MSNLLSKLWQTVSALEVRHPIRTKQGDVPSIFTRQVYDLVVGMPDIVMLTPANPINMPIGTFEFKCGTHKFQIYLRSLNGMGGIDDDNFDFDTGVYDLTALSVWRIPDATTEQVNEWNRRRHGSYAVKADEFVEIINNINLFLTKGERQIVESTVRQIISDTKDFVEFMTSNC